MAQFKDYDEIEITKLLVFGTSNPSPTDYNSHIRPKDAKQESIIYDMTEYMTTGGGRFAYPALFGAVEKFFTASAAQLPDNVYTYDQLVSTLKESGIFLSDADLRANISQYGTGIGSADHADRAYIFGSTLFKIDMSEAKFLVFRESGIKTILNFEVRAFDDDFDFETDNPLSAIVGANLQPLVDPYGLIRKAVDISFRQADGSEDTGKIYQAYGPEQFGEDQRRESEVSLKGTPSQLFKDANGIASLRLKFSQDYLSNITEAPFLSYERGNQKVIYGTPKSDTLTQLNAQPGVGSDGFFMAGGTGDDTLRGGDRGDELWGGKDNDELNGGFGNDRLVGGEDNDELNGGFGKDIAVYAGTVQDCDVQFFPNSGDGAFLQVSDKIGDRDGTDKLRSIETLEFSDVLISVEPALDIAFVVDTTSSMADNIAAVQERASEIVDAVFDIDRGTINSRFAVVGYNDPGTETILSFTDQPRIDDRKTVAIDAINRLSTQGGRDFPEVVNAGLLRALSGEAGEWRQEAAARRIILFGDAPPKDTETARSGAGAGS